MIYYTDTVNHVILSKTYYSFYINILMYSAVTWLKYSRYTACTIQSINQSINPPATMLSAYGQERIFISATPFLWSHSKYRSI